MYSMNLGRLACTFSISPSCSPRLFFSTRNCNCIIQVKNYREKGYTYTENKINKRGGDCQSNMHRPTFKHCKISKVAVTLINHLAWANSYICTITTILSVRLQSHKLAIVPSSCTHVTLYVTVYGYTQFLPVIYSSLVVP